MIDSLNKKQNEENRVNNNVLIDVFQSIPTPLEVATLVQYLGTGYHKEKIKLP